MIVPILHGIYSFTKTPVTWILFVSNLLVFLIFAQHQESYRAEFDVLMKNDNFVISQGTVFAHYVLKNSETQPKFLTEMAEAGLAGKRRQLELLGRISIRDSEFLKTALSESYEGDQVEVSYWRKNFKKLKNIQSSDVSYLLGYGGYEHRASFMNTLSYQFIHGGFLHLASNMWFLMIFGTFVELAIGSLPLLVFYLFAGIGSAFAFTFLSGDTAIPLVGASGSISGLMGAFLVLNWNKTARCMFWLLPIKGYTGFANLPSWVVMAIWFVSDLTGYISHLKEEGGVAHAAHLGGLLIGCAVALVFFRRKAPAESVLNHASGF